MQMIQVKTMMMLVLIKKETVPLVNIKQEKEMVLKSTQIEILVTQIFLDKKLVRLKVI
jgi:hypothetical protein